MLGPSNTATDPKQAVEQVFRAEHGKVIAALIRALGDFDLAEEALQEALTVALERWARDGIPPNPAAWLVTTAKRKAIDNWRREQQRAEKHAALQQLTIEGGSEADMYADEQD